MNMKKIRFGTREIVAMVIGVMLFASTRLFENYADINGLVPDWVSVWIRPGMLIVAATAVFFGPVCGMLCGIGGSLVVRALFGTSVKFLELFTMGLFGFLIGLYYGKLHYRNDRFGMREFVDFNVVQTLVGIICGIFIMPLGRFMIDGAGLNEAVVNGTKSTIGTSIMICVVLSTIVFIVSAVQSRHRGGDT